MTVFARKALVETRGGVRVGSKEDGPKGVSVWGGGCFASLVGNR